MTGSDKRTYEYGKTALMWGGLLTLFAALFHVGLIFAGPKWTYLAGIPKKFSQSIPIGETSWVVLISLLLILVSLFAFASVRNSDRKRVLIFLLAMVFLLWGITGAPISHLTDWSRGYSIFHVGAAFYITLIGACFGFAAWALKPPSFND